ncbi:MAG: hypothetical protein JWP97_6691 [Labilithrix sp.]|nr:hypothetical protein [Labilithrix sp.]
MRAVSAASARALVSLVALGSLAPLVVGCEGAESMPARTASAPAPRSTDDIDEVGETLRAPVRRAPPEFDDSDPSAVRLFHELLAGYGAWSEDARLGLVWTPYHDSVGDEFVPYATHGRWSHRSFGTGDGEAPIEEYVWVSDLPWGWATFHFGRWTYAGERGWAWVPGRRYAGAWVDWRTPDRADAPDAVIGWGPTPPSQLWRVSPGPAAPRLRAGSLDLREARVVAVPYAAFSTPYAYVRVRDLFAADVGSRLLYGPAALAVARGTQPGLAPRPSDLGFGLAQVPAPPTLDRGLQQAWMLATPASAMAVGAGPELGAPPRLRTYVAGGAHFASSR